jgi:PIN domain nuclease of toxin-antitoxin system
MADLIYLDTHVVVWLYASGAAGLSPRAADEIEAAAEIRCSPIVRLEVQYLFEVGRIKEPALVVMDALAAALGLRICETPFFGVVREAERQSWTRDPFDRLIVAQAQLNSALLLTKDDTIHAVYPRAVW